MSKPTLKEIVEKEAPTVKEGILRLLKHKTSAKTLMWLATHFESLDIVYTEDLAQYLLCSYSNAWITLKNFERYGLLHSESGVFYPTKNPPTKESPNGSFVLKKYLKYALKTRGY